MHGLVVSGVGKQAAAAHGSVSQVSQLAVPQAEKMEKAVAPSASVMVSQPVPQPASHR